MRKVVPLQIKIFFVILGLVLCVAAQAESRSRQVSEEEFRKLVEDAGLHYEDYKTTNTWNGTRQRPILDTKFKRLFKTVLTEASKCLPNFDGKYVIAFWGCGSECETLAIINIETGVISKEMTVNEHLAFRPECNILITNVDDPRKRLTEYYWWNGTELQLLKPSNGQAGREQYGASGDGIHRKEHNTYKTSPCQ